MTLLATVLGQDLEEGEHGTFRIARRVAKDRVISIVDPECRHGRKTSAHGFDGYKGHVAIEPDTEILVALTKEARPTPAAPANVTSDATSNATPATPVATIYSGAAYGTAAIQSRLREVGLESKLKTRPPSMKNGMFTRDRFTIDLEHDTVTCPNAVTVRTGRLRGDGGVAKFAAHCATCPLRSECTTSSAGRKIRVGVHEAALAKIKLTQPGARTTGPRDPSSNASSPP